jgi:hypothetical protein
VRAPPVVGADDCACRRGRTSGTVLIDLERRQPVAVWLDREAVPLAPWLRTQPGVEVITRDRARASADGAYQGAPEAIPVANALEYGNVRCWPLFTLSPRRSKTVS